MKRSDYLSNSYSCHAGCQYPRPLLILQNSINANHVPLFPHLLPLLSSISHFIIKEYKAINSREQEREVQQALILDLNVRLVISHPSLLQDL